MSDKQMVLEAVTALPDDCTARQIAEKVDFLAAIQEGLDELDCGESVPHEEVKKRLASWLTK